MNLVYRAPSGGCLWQGGAKHARSVPALENARIKAVVFAANEHQPELPEKFDILRARLHDNPFMGRSEARKVAVCADEVSDMLVAYLLAGQSVLSSCWAGWNRSGLMTAMTLMKLAKMPTDVAIARVRAARGPNALSNPVFVEILGAAERKLARTA